MSQLDPQTKLIATVVAVAAVIALVVVTFGRFYEVVEAGDAAVATLFGEVQDEVLPSGLHFPTNPLYEFHHYDIRESELTLQKVEVPSQDQLKTEIDITVIWRLTSSGLPFVKGNIGTKERAEMVQLLPNVRSVLREQGKSVERAEDFFTEGIQDQLQTNIYSMLNENLGEKGITIERVLVRNIQLPLFIEQAIERKKEREQEAERQKAELERFRTEQQQLLVQAEAERAAAEQEAERRRLLADAQAYEIRAINEAIGASENYINIRALETLQKMSENPATQIYFMDGESPMPLPLLNLPTGSENQTIPARASR